MGRTQMASTSKKSLKAQMERPPAINKTHPKSTKKPRTFVPPPQSVRIMERYASGQSIRKIALKENRDRATVTKIVRSDEMQNYVRDLREKFYALGVDAIAAVEFTLRKGKDGRLGYRILTDLGVVPSVEERNATALQHTPYDKSALTPFELAMAEEEDGRINHVAFGCACVLEESEKWFGVPLPTAAQVYHFRKLMKESKETAAGWHHEISMGSAAASDQIRRLPVKNVSSEEGRRLRVPQSSRRALPDRNGHQLPVRSSKIRSTPSSALRNPSLP